MTFAAKFRVKSLGQKKFACLSSASKCFLKQAVQTFTPINRWNLVPHSMSLPKFEIFRFLKRGQSGECGVIFRYVFTCCSLIINKAEHLLCLYQPFRVFNGICLSMSYAQLHFFFLTNMQVWFLYSGLSSLGWFKRIANMKSFDGQSS